MRATRDTFLHFIADNLVDAQNQPIPVHALRRDPDNPAAAALQVDAVNISFLEAIYDIHVADQQAVIDIVHDDELTAVDWTKAVWSILSAAAFTPKLDYSSGSPVAVGSNIYWNVTSVKFRPVASDFYFHYTCVLPLHHKLL